MNNFTIQKIHDISIVAIAERLGFRLYGTGDEGRRACCPYHDDKRPSLHFSTKRGCYKCFVCGAKGDAIKLVQDYKSLSFTEACEWIMNEFGIINTEERKPGFTVKGSGFRVNGSLLSEVAKPIADFSSEFCKALVSAGYLTDDQMRQAAKRYKLGASKEGGVIFWEIDQQNQVHTGKIMYYQPDCHRDKQHNPTWVHSLLKTNLPAGFTLQHCLFGLHLINQADMGVAIVESEKTAIICSQLFPDFIWLSCGGLQMFKPQLLEPLVHHKVIIFPDTDEKGEAFKSWTTVAQQATKQYTFRYPLRVSPLLELHATEDQKRRKIDLVDYIYEGQIQPEFSVQTT